MKKMTRKLLLSVMSLAFAIVALGTTTFAWFTMNASADASFKFNIDGGSTGILLSTDGHNFSSSITITDFDDVKLNPITAAYNETTGLITFTDMKGLGTSSNVIEFDLYFTGNSATEADFFWAADAKATSTGVTPYNLLKAIPDSGFKDGIAVGSEVNVDVLNAMRCAYSLYEDSAAMSTVQAAAAGTAVKACFTGKPTVQLYELGGFATSTAESPAGEKNRYNFGSSLANTNAANSYYQAIQGLWTDGEAADEKYVTLNDAIESTFTDVTTAIGTVANAMVTRVHFQFWLEGFDADCFDAVMSQSVVVDLKFTTVTA